MTRILLICSAGMSSSMLMQRMQTAARDTEVACRIWSSAEIDAKKYLDDVDVILLGPQVRFLKVPLEKAVGDRPVKVDVIDTSAYGMMDGKTVLAHGLRLVNSL